MFTVMDFDNFPLHNLIFVNDQLLSKNERYLYATFSIISN